MASFQELHKLAQNPAAASTVAAFLLKLPETDWTEWEVSFLETMFERREPLSTRQAEKLVELRDDAQSYATFDGFSVASLVRSCWIARLDLGEDDEGFVDALKARGVTRLKRRALMRLLRCARELGVLSGYIDIDKAA